MEQTGRSADTDATGPRASLGGGEPVAIWRIALWVIGLLLLASAVWAISKNLSLLYESWQHLRGAPIWAIAILLVMPVANLAVVSLGFSILTERYAKVGRFEMLALITSAWLLNMLPFRPGLIGRVAYHRVVNGLTIAQCVKVQLQTLVCAGVALALLLGVVVTGVGLGLGNMWGFALLALPTLGSALAAGALRMIGALRDHSGARWGVLADAWRWPAVVCLRSVDMGLWVARYALLFGVLGTSLGGITGERGGGVTSWSTSAAVACASEAAMLAPVQVGLREWVVGVAFARISAWSIAGHGESIGDAPVIDLTRLAPGLLADVVNRGLEIVVAIPMGVLATLWVQRRLRSRMSRSKTANPPNRGDETAV